MGSCFTGAKRSPGLSRWFTGGRYKVTRNETIGWAFVTPTRQEGMGGKGGGFLMYRDETGLNILSISLPHLTPSRLEWK